MLNAKDSNNSLSRLLDIMRKLRDPKHGCPWDSKQTFESIVPFTIEEAYEVADAILSGDREAIKDECGDLLFQVIFYAQLGQEEGSFNFEDIASAICDKLERRHPHVFAEQGKLSDDAAAAQWEAIKGQERLGRIERQKQKENKNSSVFAELPKGLPALKQAYKVQKAAAKVGFDWPEPAPVLEKVREEIEEIKEEMHKPVLDEAALENEIGDALFALVNLSRHYKIDADNALRLATRKFRRRFEIVEIAAAAQGTNLHEANLELLESFWASAKVSLDKNE